MTVDMNKKCGIVCGFTRTFRERSPVAQLVERSAVGEAWLDG